MGYAPVVLFVYNRPDHVRETCAALAKCPEAKETRLYVFSDGPRHAADEPKVTQVRDEVRSMKEWGAFAEVIVRESKENRGLARSVIAGVTEVIEAEDRVIVLEDDCVTSPYFLHFMNQALIRYADDERIGSIAGFSPQIPFPEDYNADAFLAYRSCSWGWATWRRCWQDVDWELNGVREFYRSREAVRRMDANGTDRFLRLYRQTRGNGTSWAVRFGLHHIMHNWLTVYPRYSYIRNIGVDGSGEHSRPEDAASMDADLSKAIAEPVLDGVELEERIQRIMKRHYSGGVLTEIKRALAEKAIILQSKL